MTAAATLLLDDGYVGTHVLLDGCTVRGAAGYSLFHASRSISHGCWYVEVSWLLPTDTVGAPQPNNSIHQSVDYAPAVRVGWCTAEAALDAPVGYDAAGFGYASRTGHTFHQARSSPYARPFVSGDVIGMLLCVDERDVSHGAIHFSVNGRWQGAAFTALPLSHYFPAVSTYQHAQVHCRFQPTYLFPPWKQQVGSGLRASWRVDVHVAESEVSYWRRDRRGDATGRSRKGKRARKKRTLYKPE